MKLNENVCKCIVLIVLSVVVGIVIYRHTNQPKKVEHFFQTSNPEAVFIIPQLPSYISPLKFTIKFKGAAAPSPAALQLYGETLPVPGSTEYLCGSLKFPETPTLGPVSHIYPTDNNSIKIFTMGGNKYYTIDFTKVTLQAWQGAARTYPAPTNPAGIKAALAAWAAVGGQVQVFDYAPTSPPTAITAIQGVKSTGPTAAVDVTTFSCALKPPVGGGNATAIIKSGPSGVSGRQGSAGPTLVQFHCITNTGGTTMNFYAVASDQTFLDYGPVLLGTAKGWKGVGSGEVPFLAPANDGAATGKALDLSDGGAIDLCLEPGQSISDPTKVYYIKCTQGTCS